MKDAEQETPKTRGRKKGWPLLILGVALSFFVGGAIKTQLSSEKLIFEINQSIYQVHSKFNIDIDQANIVLAEGLFPVFQVKINKVSLLNSVDCSEINEIQVEELLVSIGFFKSLFEKKLVVDGIKIKDLRIQKESSLCNLERSKPSESDALATENSEVQNQVPLDTREDKLARAAKDLQKFFSQSKEALARFFKSETLQTLEQIGYLEIERLVVVDKTPSLEFNDLELEILTARKDGLSAILNSKLKYPKYHLYFSRPLSLELNLGVAHLSYNLALPFKEGKIQTRGVVNLEVNSINSKSQINNFPVWKIAEVASAIDDKAFTELKSKNLWIDCQVDFSLLGFHDKSQLQFKECHLHGPDGKIQLSGMVLSPLQNPEFKEVLLKVDQFNLKSLLGYFDAKGPSGILSKYGNLNSEVKFLSPVEIDLSWSLEDVEMHFLNRGLRGYEQINRIAGKMKFKDSRFSGFINDVLLEKGRFRGQISFNLDQAFHQGVLQLSVDEIVFSPEIQNLLFGGSSSSAAIYGQAQMKDSLVEKWRGSIGFKELLGNQWSMDGLKLDLDYQKGEMKTDVEIKRLTFLEDHDIADWLNPLVFNFENKLESISFNTVSGKILSLNRAGAWKNFILKNDEVTLSTEGAWNNQGKIKGGILAQKSNKKLSWLIDGPVENLILTLKPDPYSQNIQLIGYSGDIQKKLFNGFQNMVPFYGKADRSTPIENLKKFRKKVLEEAQKMIPKSEEDRL